MSGRVFAKTCASAVAGILTVAAVDGALESATAEQVPPFESSFTGASRFDQSYYAGRVAKMMLACDPSLLLYAPDTVLSLKTKLDAFRATCASNGGRPPAPLGPTENRELWEMQRVVSSALHPDTGDTIPLPFRMSGYLPFNAPICVAMITTAGSTPALLFWSFVNQVSK